LPFSHSCWTLRLKRFGIAFSRFTARAPPHTCTHVRVWVRFARFAHAHTLRTACCTLHYTYGTFPAPTLVHNFSRHAAGLPLQFTFLTHLYGWVGLPGSLVRRAHCAWTLALQLVFTHSLHTGHTSLRLAYHVFCYDYTRFARLRVRLPPFHRFTTV